jgi:hypothetical protein
MASRIGRGIALPFLDRGTRRGYFFLNLFIKHAPLLTVILHAKVYILISFVGNAVTGIVAPFSAFPLQF